MSANPRERRRPSSLPVALAAPSLCAAALVLLIGSLLAYGAELSWLLERLCHLRFQLALAALVLLPLVLAVRRWRWALLLVAALAINLGELVEHYGLPAHHQEARAVSVAEAPGLRVFYANLLASNPSAALLAPQIQASQADLLVLLELTPAWERRLEGALASYSHRLLERREDNFGLGIYSRLPLRLPVLHASSVQGFDLEVPLAEVVVDAPWGPVRILAAHPVPPTSSAAMRARDGQLVELAALVRARAMATAVLGDLNTTVLAPSYGELVERSGLRNGLDSQPLPWLSGTWPAGLPAPLRIPIDHCLVSPELAVGELHVGSIFGSDHLPLVLELRAMSP